MEHTIEHGPSFAWLKVVLAAGDEVQAEAGAMVSRDPQVEMSTHLNAGRRAGAFRMLVAFLVALMRKLFGGETMFVNRFRAAGSGEVILAPALSGHIVHKRLGANDKLFVQTGSYLASTGEVDAKVRFTGLRSLLGGEGLVLLECSGHGDLWVNSYGGVLPLTVNGTFTVDTGHIVAFEGALDFRVRSVGGMKSLFLSGEGLVCEFSGQGVVYIQSRNLHSLVGWLGRLLPS
ncbi:MAG TPA: TIGR00266 family protein [Polyangiaceae bacterium]|nr:TIGR00266 family protein [Polyangiaceae bacterium]